MGKSTNALLGFLAGASVGAVMGILFAPDKGEKTRDRIRKSAEDISSDVRDNVGKKVDDLSDVLGDFVGEVKDRFSNIEGRLKDEAKNVKQKVAK